MLTRTRNELLLVATLTLVVGGGGAIYFRTRPSAPPASKADDGRREGVVSSEKVLGDSCPMLTSWVASPLRTSVGAWIDVAAAAVDADAGEHVALAWVPSLHFANPAAATTRFRCPEAGRQWISVRVTDDHKPLTCSSWVSLAVDCVAP
jgi:hypothetical protein